MAHWKITVTIGFVAILALATRHRGTTVHISGGGSAGIRLGKPGEITYLRQWRMPRQTGATPRGRAAVKSRSRSKSITMEYFDESRGIRAAFLVARSCMLENDCTRRPQHK